MGLRPMASVARSGPAPASSDLSRKSSGSATARTMSEGCSRDSAGRPKSRSFGPSSGTRRPSSAGVARSGPSCDGGRGASAGCWSSRTNQGSTSCQRRSGLTPLEGLTPVLREKQTRDHLSVMGAMTPLGQVYTLVRQESLNGLHCVEFLLHLLRVAGERLLVIWDGSPIHRRVEVKEFVSGTRGRVWLEALPGYAPDLNPWDEGGWHHLKNVEMRNLVCLDLEDLHQQFHLALGRLRQKPHLVQSFFAQRSVRVAFRGYCANPPPMLRRAGVHRTGEGERDRECN